MRVIIFWRLFKIKNIPLINIYDKYFRLEIELSASKYLIFILDENQIMFSIFLALFFFLFNIYIFYFVAFFKWVMAKCNLNKKKYHSTWDWWMGLLLACHSECGASIDFIGVVNGFPGWKYVNWFNYNSICIWQLFNRTQTRGSNNGRRVHCMMA